MIRVTLVSNNPRKTVLVPETKTVRQVLNENNISMNGAAVSIGGVTVSSDELDMPLVEHATGDSMTISCLVNKDNAAQAIVVGSACVIKSALTPAEINNIKWLHPEMLTMEDENGEPVFAIDIDESTPGSINDNGAVFGSAESTDGKATITVVIDPEVDDGAALVEKKFGHALLLLDELEKGIAEEMPSLQEEERRIKSMVTRM